MVVTLIGSDRDFEREMTSTYGDGTQGTVKKAKKNRE
jgi:hypothetical protein